MRQTISRAVAWAALGFVVLLGLRLGYGYLDPSPWAHRYSSGGGDGESFELEKRNYASAKIARSGGELAIDQKYERVADLRVRAVKFDDDEAAMRAAAAQHGGVIQLERKRGLPGSRSLQLAVGVPPDRFDAFVDAMRAIGVTTHLSVDKQDRTNDFKELAAKRAALDSTRAAMVTLKGKSGSIPELLQLEDRLLELEREIQGLGVSLGEFDAVNELCTVKLALAEVRAAVAAAPTIPVWRRARVAFEWAVPFYFGLLAIALVAVLIAFVGLGVLARVGAIERLVRAARLPTAEARVAQPSTSNRTP